MTDDNTWQAIRLAAEFVAEGGAKRIDGDEFKVYAVPSASLIRVDINQPSKEAQVT